MASGASQLGVYNGALRLLADRKLATLSDGNEPRRLLDDIWADDPITWCLEQTGWNFATKSVLFNGTQQTAQSGVGPPVPNFTAQIVGFRYFFAKPSDWCYTQAVCSDPYFRGPLTALQYTDQEGQWTSDLLQIYVRFVSNDSTHGKSFSLWPVSFYETVKAKAAYELCNKLTRDEAERKWFADYLMKCLVTARGKDATTNGEQFPPIGTWAGSRSGRATRRDRGSIQSLYG